MKPNVLGAVFLCQEFYLKERKGRKGGEYFLPRKLKEEKEKKKKEEAIIIFLKRWLPLLVSLLNTSYGLVPLVARIKKIKKIYWLSRNLGNRCYFFWKSIEFRKKNYAFLKRTFPNKSKLIFILGFLWLGNFWKLDFPSTCLKLELRSFIFHR